MSRSRPPMLAVLALVLAAIGLVAPGASGSASASAPVPPAPAPTAASWLVADLGSGDVLAAQAAHEPLMAASTQKVLTALALTPHLDPDLVYTATPEAAGIEGSKVGLVAGSTYTLDDLLHGLLLDSGNDAAQALAELVGGMEEAARLMQAEADRLGARSTTVRNTSGLDAEGQATSAHDLALVTRAAMQDETYRAVTSTLRYDFPAEGTAIGAGRPTFEIQNHNKLMWNYEGATGGKTGYTDAARHSFIGTAERDGRAYVAVVVRAEGRPWRQAGDLLDWAFAHGERVEPVDELDEPTEDAPDVEQLRAPATAADLAAGGAPSGDRAAASGGDQAAASSGAEALPAPRGQDGSPWLAALRTAGWVLVGLVGAVVLLRVRAVHRRNRRRALAAARRARRPSRPA